MPKNNHFHPIDWAYFSFSSVTQNIISFLQKNPIANAQVFIRGGLLEKTIPYPNSDLDLMILSKQSRTIYADWSELEQYGHPFDIKVIPDRQIHPVFSLLLHTRSLQVSGHPFDQKPVKVSRDLWDAHWRLYGLNRLPKVLVSHGPQRLSQVKQIFRSVGLIHTLDTGEFTRDLRVCLEWSQDYSPRLSHELKNIYYALHKHDYRPIPIDWILMWLHQEYEKR